MKTIIRRNVSTFLKDILEQKNRLREDECLFFRGESNFHDKRTPSLYLQKKLAEQGSEYYYRTLLNELGRDDYNESTSLVRLMAELQHYGAKTRMLDVTKSPLIALYFAVEKVEKEEKNRKKIKDDGYIYIYKTTTHQEKFDTGHTVAIKSALNLIDYEVINNFLEACTKIRDMNEDENEFKKLKSKQQEEILKKYDDDFIKNSIIKFMELLNERARVREKLKYPIQIFYDLNSAHLIIPSKSTDRIRQQQGAFIFPKYVNTRNKGMEEIKTEIDQSINELSATLTTYIKEKGGKGRIEAQFSCIKINSGDKENIRAELEQLGVTDGYIYPDIEHQSKALLK